MRYDSLFQREYSVLNGERNNPIQPLHRERGLVQIGNRTIPVEQSTYWSQADLEAQPNATIDGWNAAKRRGGHECAAMDMGEFCTHAVEDTGHQPDTNWTQAPDQTSTTGPVTIPQVTITRLV
jgi:hypothetical protein